MSNLRDLMGKATGGEWIAIKHFSGLGFVIHRRDRKGHEIAQIIGDSEGAEESANAALIVALHNLAPELMAVREAGEAVLYHDERGQGIGYAEAMKAMCAALAKLAEKEGRL